MRGKHYCVLQEITGTAAMLQEVEGIGHHRTRVLEDDKEKDVSRRRHASGYLKAIASSPTHVSVLLEAL
jgi:hypothetical protein